MEDEAGKVVIDNNISGTRKLKFIITEPFLASSWGGCVLQCQYFLHSTHPLLLLGGVWNFSWLRRMLLLCQPKYAPSFLLSKYPTIVLLLFAGGRLVIKGLWQKSIFRNTLLLQTLKYHFPFTSFIFFMFSLLAIIFSFSSHIFTLSVLSPKTPPPTPALVILQSTHLYPSFATPVSLVCT